MRIHKLNLRSTFFSLLGYVNASPATPPLGLEQLRQAMLSALDEASSEHHAKVARQLQFAGDVQTLWYARTELMAALAAKHGEARARKEMDDLTARFRLLLPRSMTNGYVRRPR
jgi:hypothetical protein